MRQQPPNLRPWPKKPPLREISGRFGLVTIVREVPATGQGRRFLVRCDCGQERYILLINLQRQPPKTHVGCARAKAES